MALVKVNEYCCNDDTNEIAVNTSNICTMEPDKFYSDRTVVYLTSGERITIAGSFNDNFERFFKLIGV